MVLLPINIDVQPVNKKHICYYIHESYPDKLQLMEVAEYFYPHPDAPDHALVQIIEMRVVEEQDKRDESSAYQLLLMQHVQLSTRNYVKNKTKGD